MKNATLDLGGRTFSCLGEWTSSSASPDAPLIVCLHGGTYSARYFDVPGYSLLSRAAALNVPAIAIDRPGYGSTAASDPSDYGQHANASILDEAMADLWSRAGGGRAGIVLIGHSIGGAIALRIAARGPHWPLLGVAVSGVGLHLSSRAGAPEFPPTPFVDWPPIMKDVQMFGPAGSYEAVALEASRMADASAPVQELMDISIAWPREAEEVLGAVEVPVHYRQGECDGLWTVNDVEIETFARACKSASSIDARIVPRTGHCIDFHRSGPGFQLEQIAFALACGVL